MVAAIPDFHTLLDREIARLEQKLAALDALYARRRAGIQERIERLEAVRERTNDNRWSES